MPLYELTQLYECAGDMAYIISTTDGILRFMHSNNNGINSYHRQTIIILRIKPKTKKTHRMYQAAAVKNSFVQYMMIIHDYLWISFVYRLVWFPATLSRAK